MTTGQMLEERGKAMGLVEGRMEGRAEGEVVGMAKLLLDLLGKRFGEVPASIAERVRRETRLEVFSRWADRLLTAESADEVVDDR